ncbi:MAG: hypothetical protein IPG07_07620 [Crocinitomicaceae bacterium]|nr:hypothetical protein [Crocinitomicaceae bacterium]
MVFYLLFFWQRFYLSKITWQLSLSKSTQNSIGFRMYPIADMSLGIEGGLSSGSPLKYNLGAGAGFDYSRKKFFITGKLFALCYRIKLCI